MYKELIISITIVIVIFFTDYITQKYTEEKIDEITNELVSIKDELNNSKDINKKINDIFDRWIKYKNKLVYYIEHDELEKVETDFITCKSFANSGNNDFALSELEKTIFVLEHISDKYSFNLENIF